MTNAPSPETQLPLAVSAIVRHEGRYLLVRRANPPAQDMYAFPGGRVEAGESLGEAALRELYEETRLRGTNPRAFRVYDLSASDGSTGFRLTAHLVDLDGDGQKTIAGDDAAEAGWFTAAEAAHLDMPQSVHECIDSLERGLETPVEGPYFD